MIKSLTLISLLLTASLSAFADEIPMAELLAKCDGMTRTGTIDPKLKDGVIGGFAEKQCATKASIAQKDVSIATLDAESQRFDQIIAILPKEDAKRALNLELTKTEQQLSTTKAPEQREKLEARIRIVKEQLVKFK